MILLPWMTSRDSSSTQGNAFDWSVFNYRFFCVFGTSWQEDTITSPSQTELPWQALVWRKVLLVEINAPNQKFLHLFFEKKLVIA